jgi:flagellar biosynthesis component FlhA
MQIVKQIVGAYIPLCCLSLPIFVFFILAAALPVAFLALSGQGAKQEARSKKQEAGSAKQEEGSREQRVQGGE